MFLGLIFKIYYESWNPHTEFKAKLNVDHKKFLSEEYLQFLENGAKAFQKERFLGGDTSSTNEGCICLKAKH